MRIRATWGTVVTVAISAVLVAALGTNLFAQNGVLFVEGTSVGVQTSVPSTTLHIVEDNPNKANRALVRLSGTSFAPQFEYQNGGSGKTWRLGANNGDHFVINETTDLGIAELRISPEGQVFVNSTQVHPDYVFDEDYELMNLEDLRSYIEGHGHLPGVLTAQERETDQGIDLTSFPLQLLEKVEELTLYILEQDEIIQDLKESNARLSERVASLEAKDPVQE